jgi:pyruvate ferredoxin oxidoreductase delta subunit
VYKDDHTDVRLLGALAKIAPHLVSLDSIVATISDPLKATSAKKAYDLVESVSVGADQGNDEVPFEFEMPGWTTMEEGLVIRGIAGQQEVAGWLQCPDSCFDITPDGFYDANMEACCGCGVCEAVCPVSQCITMVNEEAFTDNDSQWEMWAKDKESYSVWLSEKNSEPPPRSHGFHHLGQYAEEIANEST